jgi:hypothetical protein
MFAQPATSSAIANSKERWKKRGMELHSNWRFDARMRVVAYQFEILEFEFVNVLHQV